MKEIYFNSAGDRLKICVQNGYAQIVSYRLRVWEPGSNTVVIDESGNNRNPNDDCYDLPLPVVNNNKRFVQCEFSVLSPDPKPDDKYSVQLKFYQGNKEIGSEEETGSMSGKNAFPELWVVLISQ
jgi:hypothetical protein